MGALVFGQFSALLLSFLVPMILAHLLTNDDFGVYAQFNLIMAFCMSFFSFGISSELYFFYPKSDQSERKILVFQSFMLLVIIAVVTFLLFLIPEFRNLFIANNQLESNFVYLILGIFFSIPTVIISNLYVVKHDNLTSALYLPISTITRVFLIFLFYWYNPSLQSIFLALLVNYLILFIYVIIYVYFTIKSNNGNVLWNYSLLKKQVSYSIPLGIANSTRIFAQQIDKLILLSYISPAGYAIYSIASYGVPGLNQIYLSISQVYIPRMAVAFADSDLKLSLELYKSMVLKTLSYTVPVIFIVALFSPVIVPFLFSNKYMESVPYFQIYLFTFIFSAMGNGIALRASGETRRSLYAYLYSLIFIVPFTFFAIKQFGLNGAIVSAVLSSILPRILLTKYDLIILNCKLNEIFPWKEMMKILLISILYLIPFYFLIQYFTINIILSLLCISVYLILVVITEIHNNLFVITKRESKIYIDNIISYFSSKKN